MSNLKFKESNEYQLIIGAVYSVADRLVKNLIRQNTCEESGNFFPNNTLKCMMLTIINIQECRYYF